MNKNNLSGKEYLQQIKKLKIRIATMAEQVEYLKSAAQYTASSYSTMPRSPNRNIHAAEDKIVKAMDKEEQIKEMQAKLNEVVATIDRVENPTYYAIINKRYICGKTWETISAELYISVTHIHRLHNKAVEEIEKLIKDVTL